MKKEDKIEKINIITLGNATVGKTCFILRYTENFFQPVYLSTNSIDSQNKQITLPNSKTYNIVLYDTCGQERFKSISFNFIKNADGVLLMYDITNKESFEEINNWMKSIIELKRINFPVVLIGNKSDLEEKREVTKEEGENLAQLYGMSFFETTNVHGTNVEEACTELINKIIENEEYKNKITGKKEKKKISLDKSNNNSKTGCC